MGSKPKAPDTSAQNEAARQQIAEANRQRAEMELKQQQTAMDNTEKLKAIRRRSTGRSILDSGSSATNTA